MLSSGIFEQGDNPSPLGPILLNFLEHYAILLSSPLSFGYLIVEVVLPTLSTLFGTFEMASFGFEVELFSNLIPLAFFMLPNSTKKYQ
jgi:hypothetical protein